MDGGDGELGGIEAGPSVAGVAVDGGLQIDLTDALQDADEEGIDSDEASGVRGLDVTLAELWREALEQSDLLVGERDLAVGGLLLEPQEAVVLGGETVPDPDAPDAAR